jgi:hypothetical protein
MFFPDVIKDLVVPVFFYFPLHRFLDSLVSLCQLTFTILDLVVNPFFLRFTVEKCFKNSDNKV